MSIVGCDTSGWQAANVSLAGQAFEVSKATQGITYINPNHAAQVAQARAAGLLVGHYHFADGGTPEDEADYFIANADWRRGEILALDVEHPFTDNVADVVGWSVRFLTRVHSRLGVWPLLYIDSSTRGRFNWTPVAALGVGLWDAEYNSVGPSGSAPFAFVAIWQNADTNVSGGDSDVFEGDPAAWHRYGGINAAPAAPAPAAAPHPAAPVAPRPSPAPAPVLHPSECIVTSGDTLSSIAAQFHTSLAAVEAVNPGINYNLIKPGQVLHLPGAAPAIHQCIVTAGDSLSSIAAQFGTSVARLVAVNHIANPNVIQPGQVLSF
jgi:LysM repeat protein